MEYHGNLDFSKHAIETKLILAKETDRIIASFNPVLEIEFEDGSVGNLLYTALGSTKYPKEMMEILTIMNLKRME